MSDWKTQALRAHRDRLLQEGLPYTKVRRHVKELKDHYDSLLHDAVRRGMDANAAALWAQQQLGSLDQIGEQMLAATTRRSLWCRYPRLMTLVAPPLGFMAGLVSAIAIVVAMIMGMEVVFGRPELLAARFWLEPLSEILRGFALYVFPVLLSLMLVRQQLWQRVPLAYMVAGVLLLATLAGSTHIAIEWPNTASGQNGTLRSSLAHWEVENIVRLCFNVVISAAAWVWWRNRRETLLID